MKISFFCLLICAFHAVRAQNPVTAPCNCSVLDTPEKKYFLTEAAADSLLNSYLDRLWQFSRIKKVKDPFVVKRALCEGPVSEVCERALPNGRTSIVRLIMYNDYFLTRLNARNSSTTLVDKHILLHELAHHLLGHHKNAKSTEALQLVYQQRVANPKLWSKFGSNNPMAQELEADIFAVWALSRLETGFKVQQLIGQFNQRALNDNDQASGGTHGDHPLFKDRIETMRKFETEMIRASSKSVRRGYFSDIASTAYLALWPESYVYDLSVSIGAALAGKTDFSVDGERTDGFLYPFDAFSNFSLGVSLARFRWNKPIQTSLEVQWAKHRYGTTIPTNAGKKLAEKFTFSDLTMTPGVLWNSIGSGRQQSLRSLRLGFLAGVGVNLRVPLGKLDYTNYIASADSPDLRFSVGPKATVGLALMKKSFLPRGAKLLFSYNPQYMRFKTDSAPKAISHNLECTLQYSILRW